MTEEEAKTKWCPQIRECSADGGVESVNRETVEVSNYNCIASDCMMWVWKYNKEENRILYKDYNGHCGLAK